MAADTPAACWWRTHWAVVSDRVRPDCRPRTGSHPKHHRAPRGCLTTREVTPPQSAPGPVASRRTRKQSSRTPRTFRTSSCGASKGENTRGLIFVHVLLFLSACSLKRNIRWKDCCLPSSGAQKSPTPTGPLTASTWKCVVDLLLWLMRQDGQDSSTRKKRQQQQEIPLRSGKLLIF